MVTQYDIEKAATDYLLETGKEPRFVLLDSKTYKAFGESFKPKERIRLVGANDTEYRPTQICLDGFSMEIVEVVYNGKFFQVV